jgi:hypothetical protein
MNLVQRLVRVMRTIDGIQSVSIHFFFAAKCTNQAKPLLPRFSAVFAVSRIRTRRLNRARRKPAPAISCQKRQTDCAIARTRTRARPWKIGSTLPAVVADGESEQTLDFTAHALEGGGIIAAAQIE